MSTPIPIENLKKLKKFLLGDEDWLIGWICADEREFLSNINSIQLSKAQKFIPEGMLDSQNMSSFVNGLTH